jgi:hypothetical protein
MVTVEQRERVRCGFATDGYAILHGLVSRPQLQQLDSELNAEFVRARGAGELFSGGGMYSGHLNLFPGATSRFVYDALEQAGVIELVRELSPQAVRMPNIGGNFNLPGSKAQNNHIDGYAATSFMIVNVAVVDTTLENGAIELTPGSHRQTYRYHEFVLARRPSQRITMSVGDVLLRSSALWHRGMPNMSRHVRPMLGFTWEDGGSQLDDPYAVFDGRIRFLPNRYRQDFAGMVRERAFARLPSLGASYLFLRSLLS